MAYTTANNNTFHERMQRLMIALHEVAFSEGDRLDQIYTNETASGTAQEWQDTPIASATECTEGIVLVRALQSFPQIAVA